MSCERPPVLAGGRWERGSEVGGHAVIATAGCSHPDTERRYRPAHVDGRTGTPTARRAHEIADFGVGLASTDAGPRTLFCSVPWLASPVGSSGVSLSCSFAPVVPNSGGGAKGPSSLHPRLSRAVRAGLARSESVHFLRTGPHQGSDMTAILLSGDARTLRFGLRQGPTCAIRRGRKRSVTRAGLDSSRSWRRMPSTGDLAS
jgi:hypothetical protein